MDSGGWGLFPMLDDKKITQLLIGHASHSVDSLGKISGFYKL